MTLCSCHVTYAFQSESTLYSCLNVKELLARSRREIWSLSDCNRTRTQNHLVHKRTLNHLVYELSGSGFESNCFSYFSTILTRGAEHALFKKNSLWLLLNRNKVSRFIWDLNIYSKNCICTSKTGNQLII